jgi:tetratricopeptide (TPR) repeat protein
LKTLEARVSYARYVREPSAAFPLISAACTAYSKFHPEIIEPRVDCESYRAFLAGSLGDHGEELRLYDEIVAIAAGTANADVATRAALAAGYARLLRGDARGAAAALRKVVHTDAGSTYWWERVRAAHAELGIGMAERSLGHPRDARDHLERALAIYNDATMLNEEAEYRLRAALAERTLAEVRREQAAPGANRHPGP